MRNLERSEYIVFLCQIVMSISAIQIMLSNGKVKQVDEQLFKLVESINNKKEFLKHLQEI